MCEFQAGRAQKKGTPGASWAGDLCAGNYVPWRRWRKMLLRTERGLALVFMTLPSTLDMEGVSRTWFSARG